MELRELAQVVLDAATRHQEIIRLYGPELVDGEDLTAAPASSSGMAAEGDQVSGRHVQQVWRRFKVELEAGARLRGGWRDPDG